MGYGDMGGNNPASKIPTPHLDRLAAEGMRFTDAHAPSSVCTPSRYSILTGRYSWRTRLKKGVVWPCDPPLIEASRPTVASVLKESGYATGCVGKWHLGVEWATKNGAPVNDGVEYGSFSNQRRRELEANIDYTKPIIEGPLDVGFDYYFGVDAPNFPPYTWIENDRVTEIPTAFREKEGECWAGSALPDWKLDAVMPTITRKAVDFIETRRDQPFFLYFPLTAPHTPIVPGERFRGQSGAGDYGDFVCEVDWSVGQIMDALEQAGVSENTLVIFTSDNGPEWFAYDRIREHAHYSMGEWRGVKRDTWEGGHRVPFVAKWPAAIQAGSTCDALVTSTDLMATAAAMADVRLPSGAGEDSVNILPLLTGESAGPVRGYAIHHTMSGRLAIRRGDWVYLEAPGGGDSEREPEWFRQERGYEASDLRAQLYDLKNDPAESCNVIGEHPDLAASLAALLDAVRGEGGPQPHTDLPDESLTE